MELNTQDLKQMCNYSLIVRSFYSKHSTRPRSWCWVNKAENQVVMLGLSLELEKQSALRMRLFPRFME